jgi:hypothetical protein
MSDGLDIVEKLHRQQNDDFINQRERAEVACWSRFGLSLQQSRVERKDRKNEV